MTITNNFEIELAKAVNNEVYKFPGYQAVGTGVTTSIDITATALNTEIGTRNSLTGVRNINTVEFTTIRSSTDVVSTSTGDVITNTGMTTDSVAGTSDLLLTGIPVSGVTHTINFDLEFINSITIQRQ